MTRLYFVIINKAMLRKPAKTKTSGRRLDFTTLVETIQRIHEQSAAQANHVINVSLTLRNWAIGAHIREYEQQGADRASYGTRLLEKLSTALQECLDRCYTGRYLGLCRQIFDAYPAIRKSLIFESAWSNMPLRAWTTACLSQNTSSNSPAKKTSVDSWK